MTDPYADFSSVEKSDDPYADFATTEQKIIGDDRSYAGSERPEKKAMDYRADVGSQLKLVNFDKGLDAGMRADLSFSNLDEEKRMKFLEKYPEGELKRVQTANGESDLYFRKGKEGTEWSPVDKPGLEWADLADLAGEVPPLVAASAATTVGGPFLGGLVRAFIGGAGAHLAGQEVDALRGKQAEGQGSILLQSMAKGGEMAAGQGVGSILSKSGSAAAGSGFLTRTPDQQSIISAAHEMGTYPTRGQVSSHPMWEQAEGYIGRLSGPIRKQRLEQAKAIRAYKKEVVGKLGGGTVAGAGKTIKEQGSQIIEDLKSVVDSEAAKFSHGISYLEAGKSAKEGVEALKHSTFKTSGALYTKLDEMAVAEGENIKVNIGSVKAYVINQKPVTGRVTIKRTTINPSTGGKTINHYPTYKSVSSDLNKNTAGLIKDIKALDKVQDLDTIRALRTRAWEASQHAIGEPATNSHRIAGEIFRKIDNALETGVKIKNPQVLSQYRRASRYWRAKSQRLEDDTIKTLLKTDRPDEALSILLQPNRVSRLWKVRNSIPRKQWDTVRKAFMGRVMQDPTKIVNNLDRFDKKTLNILLTKSEQKSMRTVQSKYNDITNSPLAKIVNKQKEYGQILSQYMSGKNVDGAIELMVQLGGKQSAGGRAARAGFLDQIISKAIKVDRKTKQAMFDGELLTKTIQKLHETGNETAILTSSDMKALHNIALVGSMNKSAGAGLVAASTTAKIVRGDIIAKAQLLAMLGYMHIAGRIITSKASSRFLYGAGKEQIKMPVVENLARILTVTSDELANDYVQMKRLVEAPAHEDRNQQVGNNPDNNGGSANEYER